MTIPAPIAGALFTNNGVLENEPEILIQELVRVINLLTPIRGTATPEGSIIGSPDQHFWDATAGVMYFKDTGTGNTGWVSL